MKTKLLLSLGVIICSSVNVQAQLGVDVHQSNLPFVGIHYQMTERFIPEIRIGTDISMRDLSFELDLNFIILKNDEFEFYSGIGGRTNVFKGIVVPVGLNVYPFETKNFGFQIEVASLIRWDEEVLRGSWGIRYRFK